MIKVNIRTYDKIVTKSFVNKNDLVAYCKKILCVVPQQENAPQELANKIWETNVGQFVRSNIGHRIAVAGKSFDHNAMLGDK